jgi:activator of HSP90 ATPase
MTESLQVSAFFAGITPERLYSAWLDSEQHAAFTGSPAKVDPQVGGSFTAWDGYIQGATLELEPFLRILQSWRTTEFPEDSPDSSLEVLVQEEKGGARLTLIHTQIPDGQAESYRQGWEDYYFQPMQAYFSGA